MDALETFENDIIPPALCLKALPCDKENHRYPSLIDVLGRILQAFLELFFL